MAIKHRQRLKNEEPTKTRKEVRRFEQFRKLNAVQRPAELSLNLQ